MDGIRGEVKSLVSQQVLSKTKNIIVDNARDFATLYKAVMPNVTVHLMEQDNLSKAQQLSSWDNAPEI